MYFQLLYLSDNLHLSRRLYIYEISPKINKSEGFSKNPFNPLWLFRSGTYHCKFIWRFDILLNYVANVLARRFGLINSQPCVFMCMYLEYCNREYLACCVIEKLRTYRTKIFKMDKFKYNKGSLALPRSFFFVYIHKLKGGSRRQ